MANCYAIAVSNLPCICISAAVSGLVCHQLTGNESGKSVPRGPIYSLCSSTAEQAHREKPSRSAPHFAGILCRSASVFRGSAYRGSATRAEAAGTDAFFPELRPHKSAREFHAQRHKNTHRHTSYCRWMRTGRLGGAKICSAKANLFVSQISGNSSDFARFCSA